MSQLSVSIVTPERSVVSDKVDQIIAPSVMGEVGILPMHRELLAGLSSGIVTFLKDDHREYFAISGGFLEVTADEVSVLVESAEAASDIDVERAKAAKRDAVEKLESYAVDSIEYSQQHARLQRAEIRLEVAAKTRH